MKINIGNETIASVDFSSNETAWRIEDAFGVLKYLKDQNKVVLGGDILTKELVHNYDSWYYNINPSLNYRFNVENGYKSAIEYISNYIRVNGNVFYVIFVTN